MPADQSLEDHPMQDSADDGNKDAEPTGVQIDIGSQRIRVVSLLDP